MRFSFVVLAMYETIKQFYKSNEWQKCRASYLKKAKGLCERCLAKGIIKPGEEVHHKIRLTKENINKPEIATCFDNLELLCKECHHIEHDGAKRYRIDKQTGYVDVIDIPT